MEKRIKFRKGEQRKFIEDVLVKSNKSIEEISNILKTHPRTLRDWRREKLNISLKAARFLKDGFKVGYPEDEKTMVKRWEVSRSEANKAGGYSRFLKYGSPGTPEGRSRGGKKAIMLLRKNGVIPEAKKFKPIKHYNEDLSEWVGLVLGDGGITKDQVTVTLNSIKDRDYVYYVSKLSEELFGEKPSIFKDKRCNAIKLILTGVNLVKTLTVLGLKIGNKVKQQVGVPPWVIENKTFCTACLRGLMDTDGGVFIHNYTVNNKRYSYKKISFTNRSLPLLLFVFNTLKSMGFNPKLIDRVENKKVWLYNCSEVKRYFEAVGSHNTRLLNCF